MKLSRYNVTLIVTIMIIALGGLVALQARLLMEARDHKEQAFKQNVNAALSKVAQELETGEVISIALTGEPSDSAKTGNIVGHYIAHAEIRTEDSSPGGPPMSCFQYSMTGSVPVSVRDGWLRYRLDSPQRVKIQVFDSASGKDVVMVDSLKQPGEYAIDLKDTKYGKGAYLFRVSCDSGSATLHASNGVQTNFNFSDGQSGTRGKERREMVARIIDQLDVLQFKPIERRIDTLKLDSSLAKHFLEAGIETPYAYGVLTRPDNSLRVARPANYSEELKTTEFRANLFPMEPLAMPSQLVAYFPEQSDYVQQQVFPMLASTIIFMLVVTGCFAYTVQTIIRQRRFAEVTVDFINNMTHEFKTPISTVALATEAILKPEVAQDPSRVERFGKMIQEENVRMRRQVEKILQMAALEERDFELALTEVDMHSVIERAVQTMALHVEARHGSITTSLAAANPHVRGDALHMANIVHNLLDNANKYSPEKPLIAVATRNEGSDLIISVADAGVGIAPKDQKLIFQKFFRVPSGNVHDVKGFGIGLAYVKLMTETQGGHINLRSDQGVGTTVELSFPTIPVSRRENA